MTGQPPQTPGAVVAAFIQAVNRGDWHTFALLAADDIVFENVPIPPPSNVIEGLAAVRKVLEWPLTLCTDTHWDIGTQLEVGDTVMHERVDVFTFPSGTFPGGEVLAWPVAAVWSVTDGKIQRWRDYYDLGVTQQQLGVSMQEFGSAIAR